MSIVVTCHGCQARFQAKDEHAGKRARCPKCQTVMTVPMPPPQASSPPVSSKPAAVVNLVAAPAAQPDGAGRTRPTPTAPTPTAPAARQPVSQAKPAPARGDAPAPMKVRASLEPEAQPPVPLSPRQRASQILSAFQGTIEPIELSSTYWLSAALVAAGMVVLPLVYVGLVGLVGYLIYYHATHDLFWLGLVRGRAALYTALAYAAPIVAGLILLLFMIKPLFSRSAYGDRGRSLTRTSDPFLFAFVERVCQAIGAPQPVRIDVDCQVNASASFRRGMFSMMSDDLVLTIGVPLVAGLTLDEFAGVLAHEFGHFTQRTGMRMTYLIRRINGWFARVVYERDVWDQRLIEITESLDIRIGVVFYLAYLFVWLTRCILWVLMMIGHALAGMLLRQMEYDADRHEIRLVGSKVFESSLHQISKLDVAHSAVFNGLPGAHHIGMLPDDLPQMTLAAFSRIPQKVETRLNESLERDGTGLFDTHPSPRDRNARARQEDVPGVFHFDAPATVLFSAFPALRRNVTLDLYRAAFGRHFRSTDMQPVETILARMDSRG